LTNSKNTESRSFTKDLSPRSDYFEKYRKGVSQENAQYSRMRYIEYTLSIDVYTLIQCHLNAFRYFGGYTKEILYDNMKQIVIARALKSSDSEWNTKYEDFFRHYGFIPRLCRPYRAQTKGKIENNVGYVRRDFFLGGSFSSLADMNSQTLT